MKIAVVTARAPQTFSSAKGVRNDNTQRSLVSKYQPPSSLSHIELSHTTPQTLRNKRTSEPSHLNKFSSHRNSYTLRMSSTKQSTFAGRTGSDVEYQASDYGAIYSSKNPVRNKTRLESAGPSFSTRYERSYKRANGKSIKNVNNVQMSTNVVSAKEWKESKLLKPVKRGSNNSKGVNPVKSKQPFSISLPGPIESWNKEGDEAKNESMRTPM